ncbi:hypothetical protein M422DRAFT_82514, partial [Sphaerobolus stellatus SS14]
EKAVEFLESFETYRNQAQEALLFAQGSQQCMYNQGRIMRIFETGDLVLVNPHSLELLRKVKGRGKKLQMKYDRPFEVMEWISPITYRLHIPDSYGIHPIINI